jgi:hypothetical protein
MSTRNDEPRDVTTLSAAEREWLRRQGKAARTLETRQRQAARRAAWRARPAGAGRKRSRSA